MHIKKFTSLAIILSIALFSSTTQLLAESIDDAYDHLDAPTITSCMSTCNSVTLTWSTVDCDQYRIRYARSDSTDGSGYVIATTKTSATITDLDADTNYCFKARSAVMMPNGNYYYSAWSPEVIYRTGSHEYVVSKEIKPTCDNNGNKILSCKYCGAEKQESIPKLGHDYNHFRFAAKIGIEGKEYDECSRCGNRINETVIPALSPSTTAITKLITAKRSITVKWLKKSYTGYEIRYSIKSDMSGAKIARITKNKTTSKKISNLKSKKKYYVQIRTYKTVNGVKYPSSWSAKKSATTK